MISFFVRLDSTRTLACVVFAVASVCAVIQTKFPIEPPELWLLLLGSAAATLLHSSQKSERHLRQKRSPKRRDDCSSGTTIAPSKAVPCEPLPARVFSGLSLEEQVGECIEQLHLTKHELLLEKVRATVQDKLREIAPEVSISLFVSGDIFARYSACAVAVPDVEVVAHIDASDLRKSMLRLCTKERVETCDAALLQKLALRAFAKAVLQIPRVKFRRSAFQADEPKVTLLWSTKEAGDAVAFAFDFSVNHGMAQSNAALLAACEEVDARAKHLVLLVRRWAKDRGICLVQKQHLPPYAWSILVIYFLQLGLGEDRLLPFFRFYDDGRSSVSPDMNMTLAPSNLSVAELLVRFFQFYSSPAGWASEVISVISIDEYTTVNLKSAGSRRMPRIEDPFQRHLDLSACLTPETRNRMQEELHRANDLLTNASTGCLAKLLEAWVPYS